MTTYRVPYTFIPGTKAKATEVNANFNAVVDLIEETNSNCADKNLSNLSESGKHVIYENSAPTRMIGEIVTSTIPLTDSGLHLLDGSLISGSGVYNDFVTHISGLISTHPNLFCSEETWQASITNYGVCGKFVYNSTNNTVRLPKISGFIEGTEDDETIGDITEAGLPNITGSTYSYSPGIGFSGALYSEGTVSSHYSAELGGTSNYISIDASKCSDIYGNSSTVQPQSTKVLYYIVVSNIAKLDIVTDIDNIAVDLNAKADTDLLNATINSSFASKLDTAGIRTITETYSNGSSWYRVYSDGWCEQGGVAPSSAGDGHNKVVTLLKAYKNTSYTVITDTKNASSSVGIALWCYGAKNLTTTSFECWNNSSYVSGLFWVAMGYIE